jgi:hypothetical protein
MLKIAHRINNPAELLNIDPGMGVEMDIHAFGDRLVVCHDALLDGPDLEDWLKNYHHALVIFNIKEEGIEEEVRALAARYGITNYFFLDLSFPALIKMTKRGESRIAVRVSEYEPAAGAISLADKVEWVWLDVFHGWPISSNDYQMLRDAGLKLCLVSPELHGANRTIEEIAPMRKIMRDSHVTIDAVCTKRPDLW